MKRYWVIKTRADIDRKNYIEHYYKFIDPNENNGNKVIAIGWHHGPKNGKASLNDLIKFMKKRYYKERDIKAEKRARIAAKTVSTFIHEMQIDDEVLLCKGFTPKQKQPIMVYAFCRIIGPYWEHKKCKWFKRKRNSEYEHIIEKKVDKEMLAFVLGKGSLLKTIHKIDEEHFQKTKAALIG
jgi:hypothetical protein